jgi:hypothetical protein
MMMSIFFVIEANPSEGTAFPSMSRLFCQGVDVLLFPHRTTGTTHSALKHSRPFPFALLSKRGYLLFPV